MRPLVPLVVLLATIAAPACLVPLPLDVEKTPDAGQHLRVISAKPMFGTQPLGGPLDPFAAQIDVECDNPLVAARLYAKINASCCDLNVEDNKDTIFSGYADATPVSPGTGAMNLYTIEFRQAVLPCNLNPSGKRVYIVPVLASGGFPGGPAGFRPEEGLGTIDRTHFWEVNCP